MNKLRCFMIAMLVLGTGAWAQQTVKLTSLEWPPFSGKDLPEQGASVAVARAAFQAMGYKLDVQFLPWERAVYLAKNDAGVAGYFPEYYSDDNAKDFHYSDPAGSSPIGFAQRVDNPVAWDKLDDLKGVTIGTVSGYINTDEFDAMAADKQLKVVPVADDLSNLRILAQHSDRIALAVIDRNVFRYLLKTTPELRGAQKTLAFNAKILADKKLYVCFKNSADGAKLADIFNQGLKKIDADKILAQYLSRYAN